MNTPNKLTLLRVLLVPFFIFFLLMPGIPYNYLIALVIFVVASLTDWFDGKLARKHDLVTNFGKFLDPLADKILVTAALLCMQALGLCNVVAVIIIIFREFLVTSLRLIAVEGGVVIAASIWGKVKTAFTMFAMTVVFVLLALQDASLLTSWNLPLISDVLMWIAAALTLLSGAHYLWKNRSLVNTMK